MGNRYQVDTGQQMVTVVDDLTTQYRVLVSGRVLSAVFGLPLPQFSVTAVWPGLFVKTLPDGFFCLAGVENLLFPVYPVTFDVAIAAPFHRPVIRSVTIAGNSDLPITLPDVTLQNNPVRLQGRVTLDDPDHTPVAGATVTIDDTAVLTLRTPLHFDHPAGTPIQPVSLTPSGVSKTLTAPAGQLSDTITLNNRTGLAPGHVLRLGAADRAEYAIIAAIVGNPAVAGDVVLTAVLQRSLPRAATAERITVGAPGAAVNLLDDVLVGEGVLRLAGTMTAVAIQITDAAPARREFHSLNALSDAQGYYRLDGLSRLAAITLRATSGPDNDSQDWTVNYRQPVNAIDFRLD